MHFISSVQEKLDLYFEKAFKEKKHLGLSLGVLDNDKTQFLNYGFCDKNLSKKINEHKFFEMASLGKVYTSLLFAKFICENLISENDNVHKFIPKINKNFDIKIINLLNHTSGIAVHPSNFKFIAPMNSYINYSDNDLQEAINSDFITAPIKTEFSYSSFAYLLLGVIAKKIADENSFSKILTYNILNPLGLNSTKFKLSNSDMSMFCSGHDPELNPISYLDLGEVYSSAGALKTTVSDLMKFLSFYFNSESSPEGFEKIFNKALEFRNSNEELIAGFSFHRKKLESGEIAFYHSGSIAGNKSSMVFLPNQKRGIVYFSNTLSHVRIIWELLCG